MADTRTTWFENATANLAEAFARLAKAQRHLAAVRALQAARAEGR